MNEFLVLCGYDLAGLGFRVTWVDQTYRGCDRAGFGEIPREDCYRQSDSELRALYDEYFQDAPYLTSLDQSRRLCSGFRRHGSDIEVIRIRVDRRFVADTVGFRNLQPLLEDRGAHFEFLGYDAGWLLGRHSIIRQPGFMSDADDATQRAWAARLNENGLFETAEECEEFRALYFETHEPRAYQMNVLEVAAFVE